MADNVWREGAVRIRDSVRKSIERFLERTQVDELVVTCHAHDQAARVRSLQIGLVS